MAGRRLGSYRKGDWNEELGILLLKSIAAVAPIPRQEDFGLDAVATLLRPENNLVYAEDSFYVQFKSESRAPFLYRDHELEWLKNLQLPLFIGQVRRRESALHLFPTHHLNEVLILRDFREFKELVLKLKDRSGANFVLDEDRCEVFLGEPLLTLNIQQASDSVFTERAYRILRDYLRFERQNLNSRRLRFYRHLKWTTNEKVLREGHLVALRSAFLKDDLYDACESIVPSLQVIRLYAESQDKALVKKLSSLVNHLREFFTTPEAIGESGYIQWEDPTSSLKYPPSL
jgi:hypothetical protein